LKQAMRRLGPSGFPFEKYVSDIFKQLGFSVQINKYIKGKCVRHEIDFLAEEEKYILIGECKYHSLPGGRVDLKVGLIHYARFLDLKLGDLFKRIKSKKLKARPIIVTNTKFTSKIIKYSECTGIDLLGWKYPDSRGLEYIIESEGFYPITILPSLTGNLLTTFSEEKLMLVQDLLKINTTNFSKKQVFLKKDLCPQKRSRDTIKREIKKCYCPLKPDSKLFDLSRQ
jgi:Restriction endonuclease.